MKIFLGLFILFTYSAHAQNWGSTVVVSSSAGVIVGSQNSIYRNLIQRELKGWSQKETGSSVQLIDQCDVQAEFHLLGNNRLNYLLLAITNSRGEPIAIKYSNIKFIMNDGRERFPNYTNQISDQRINSQWWAISTVPFPSKSDFKDFNQLKIEVPLYSGTDNKVCKLIVEFKKAKSIRSEETPYTVADFMFDIGPSLLQTGNVRKLGKPSVIWGMDFNFYVKPNHGLGFAFQDEALFKGTDQSSPVHKGNIISFDLHYVYRHFISDRLHVNFEPGLGWQTLIEDSSCRYCDQQLSSAFMLDYRLMFQWVFNRWNIAGVDIMDFFVGAGIVQQWAPHDKFRGTDINGSRIGGLLRIGMGF
jgi:hypothetical protein